MNIEDFIHHPVPILDVRSPSEFIQGHIPAAQSFPLFSDDERCQVGTIYKKEGKDAAVKLGLNFVGPKLTSFVEHAETLAGSKKSLYLYCARGGMRSSSLAWLLQTAGFQCTVLKNGYKAFRQWVLSQFQKEYLFIVLGGFTGSGKTDLLLQLKKQNEQIIDLEEIAMHQGSSFGHLGCSPQPSTEHFENILAWKLSQFNLELPIWIEDESRMIGSCCIPQDLWSQKIKAPFLWIESSKEDRIRRLLHNYGGHSQQDLISATERLVKKLGAVRTKQIIESIHTHKIENAISMLLEYYDQTYAYSCLRNNRAQKENFYLRSDPELIDKLIKFSTFTAKK